MADETSRPRAESFDNVEDNVAQRQSDAPDDAVAEAHSGIVESSGREDGGSTANGSAAGDEADDELRRKQYKEGATLVSRMD